MAVQPTGTGKGGDFTTRTNPFTQKVAPNHRPEFSEERFLGTAIDAIINQGCALIIGATRDGGAVVLTILAGAQRHRTYCSNSDELEEAITEIIALYKD